MPKKFNRTLWVKRDGFLLIERKEDEPHACVSGDAKHSFLPYKQVTIFVQTANLLRVLPECVTSSQMEQNTC